MTRYGSVANKKVAKPRRNFFSNRGARSKPIEIRVADFSPNRGTPVFCSFCGSKQGQKQPNFAVWPRCWQLCGTVQVLSPSKCSHKALALWDQLLGLTSTIHGPNPCLTNSQPWGMVHWIGSVHVLLQRYLYSTHQFCMLFLMDYVHLTSSNMTKSDLHEVELANGTMDCKDQFSFRLKKSRKSVHYLC